MKPLHVINPEGVTPEERATFDVRKAARGVVHRDGVVALLHVAAHNYYKLPGGGLEGAEDYARGFTRECLEEIGREVTVTHELGEIHEYRRMYQKHQISYCYVATAGAEQFATNFDEGETALGFAVRWVPFEEAVALVKNSDRTQDYMAPFVIERDYFILEQARPFVLE